MSATPLPIMKEVRDLYEMLLGRIVEVSSDCEILRPDEGFRCCVVFLNSAMGAIRAARIMNLDLCAYVRTALRLIPAAGAQGYINNGCLDDSYIESIYGALSVFSSLFDRGGAPHVSTSLTYIPGEELPADKYKMVTPYVERRDSILDIEGYGEGRFGVMCFN